jgi:hypothetical protein
MTDQAVGFLNAPEIEQPSVEKKNQEIPNSHSAENITHFSQLYRLDINYRAE